MNKLIRKLPIVKKVFKKVYDLKTEIASLKKEMTIISKERIDLRLALKMINGEKVNIVFVCMRPAIWGSLKTVYEAFKADPAFCVKIVAIPNKNKIKGLEYNHDIYESEGAEDFFKSENCINGYDYDKKTWLDLRTLEPDYVFIQQPYNICRSEGYKSDEIVKYAKLCYVPYYGTYSIDDILSEVNPLDFVNDVSFYFSENKSEYEFLSGLVKDNGLTEVCLTGFPRFDLIRNKSVHDKTGCGRFKILWTPRWTTNEGNCGFFIFKDLLLKFCDENSDFELIFRPHPQMAKELMSTGEFSDKQWDGYIKEYENRENASIDKSQDYMPIIYSSDVLFTDKSTMLVDFLPTGKPIIFYDKNSDDISLFEDVKKGLYCIKDFKQFKSVLYRLKNGEDPLKETREKILKEVLCVGNGDNGIKVKEIIKSDALKTDVSFNKENK